MNSEILSFEDYFQDTEEVDERLREYGEELTVEELDSIQSFIDDTESSKFDFENVSYEECLQMIVAMERYEQEAIERLNAQVKVYTCEEYSQEFLLSLIPKRR